jgi:hypothetical protein
LEARHAVFFDMVGIPYEYEKQGYILPNGEPYLPDFQLYPGSEHRFWLEVKAREPDEAEIAKCAQLKAVTGIDTYLYFDPQFNPAPPLEWVTLDDFFDDVVWEFDGRDYRGVRVPRPWKRALPNTAFAFLGGQSGEAADRYWWTDCPRCGRVVLKLHGQVGWCPSLGDEGIADLEGGIYPDFRHRTARLLRGYDAARSARFEHGETP